MSATFQWTEKNGAGGAVTDGISNVNFGSIDSANLVPATYPIVAGQHSFEKFLRAKFAGTFTQISNMKFWKSVGVLVTGETIKAAVTASYTTPVASASVVATVDIPTSEGSALAVTPANINAPGYTDYMVVQMQTSGSSPAGSVNQKTLNFKYDET